MLIKAKIYYIFKKKGDKNDCLLIKEISSIVSWLFFNVLWALRAIWRRKKKQASSHHPRDDYSENSFQFCHTPMMPREDQLENLCLQDPSFLFSKKYFNGETDLTDVGVYEQVGVSSLLSFIYTSESSHFLTVFLMRCDTRKITPPFIK